MKRSGILISIASSFVLVLIWYAIALVVGASIIVPTPVQVLKTLVSLVSDGNFIRNIGFTVLRAVWSFAIVVVCGGVLGILAGMFPWFLSAMKPVVTVFKATPVMSVILIAFLWLRTGEVPVFSAFLMAFPVMFIQTAQGYVNIDPKLEQMCDVYQVYGMDRVRNLIIPALKPALVTGARQTLSLIWKVVIAAEVLTLPKNGIGRSMQLAQIQLETSTVYAWTLVAVVLTACGDLLFDLVGKCISGRRVNHAD